MEDEEHGLVRLGADLLLDVCLVLAEQLGVELHVSRLVHSMNVTESGGAVVDTSA